MTALMPPALADADLLRYSRHLLLPDWSEDAHLRVARAQVLVVGLGGLGCSAAQFLASSGVGTQPGGALVLADEDCVDASNLQRQVLHSSATVGLPKVQSAAARLLALNPQCQIDTLPLRLAGTALQHAVAAADLVLDCCDNLATRRALNAACVQTRTPLISGAAVAYAGQVIAFDSRQASSPCYHCLYPEIEHQPQEVCATTGVFAPLVGVVGSLQAGLALQHLACLPVPYGRLQLLDLHAHHSRSIQVPRRADCAVCGTASSPAVGCTTQPITT